MGSNQPQMQMNKSVMKGIFEVLGSFLGIEEKDSKIKTPKKEDLEKGVETVIKEEGELGATERIEVLGNDLTRYKVSPEELTVKTKEQEEIKNKGKEIGD